MLKCLHCHTELTRRDKERRAEFLSRKYCNQKCSVADRPRLYAAKRAAQDLKDREAPPITGGLTFTKEEILHRAHMTAPQIPIAVLDEVLRDVEPMLSANVRHRMLAPMAAQIRAQRVA